MDTRPGSETRPVATALSSWCWASSSPATTRLPLWSTRRWDRFNHIGIEVPDKQTVDETAARAKQTGCLILGPQQMPKRIGYICFLRDPEGNIVEFSYDQGVYEKAREVWGNN